MRGHTAGAHQLYLTPVYDASQPPMTGGGSQSADLNNLEPLLSCSPFKSDIVNCTIDE